MRLSSITRKARTAAGMLLARNGANRLQAAVRDNVRNLIVDMHGGRPFRYPLSLGFPFVCIPHSATSRQLYVSNSPYEEVEANVCRAWLRPGDNCLDIGANVGVMSTLFAQGVGPAGMVIAVEPVPATEAHLRQAIELLTLQPVRIEQVCVSDRQGTVDFMVPDQDGADILASLKVAAEVAPGFHRESVESTTLNLLVRKHRIEGNVALVKIDIEGAEPLALEGASSLCAASDPPLFLIEVHKAALANFSYTPADVLRFFPRERFDLYHVQRSKSDATPRFELGVLYPLADGAAHVWPWYSNIIAVPRQGRFAERRSRIASLLN